MNRCAACLAICPIVFRRPSGAVEGCDLCGNFAQFHDDQVCPANCRPEDLIFLVFHAQFVDVRFCLCRILLLRRFHWLLTRNAGILEGFQQVNDRKCRRCRVRKVFFGFCVPNTIAPLSTAEITSLIAPRALSHCVTPNRFAKNADFVNRNQRLIKLWMAFAAVAIYNRVIVQNRHNVSNSARCEHGRPNIRLFSRCGIRISLAGR